jgi:hypothetical protein
LSVLLHATSSSGSEGFIGFVFSVKLNDVGCLLVVEAQEIVAHDSEGLAFLVAFFVDDEHA